MGFGHGVVDRDVVFVFHGLEAYGVVRVGDFGFKRGEGDAAADHDGLAGGLDGVATDGADVEFAFLHVGGPVAVGYVRAGEQLDHRDSEGFRKGLNQADVREAAACFPLADCLAADTDALCQFFLGEMLAFP